MNIQKSKYWIVALFFASLISCEKEVKNGIPEFKHKLVVGSFISAADTVSYVSVSSNKRIYGDLKIYDSPGTLSCYISDDIKEIPLWKTTTGFKFYPADMKIEEGKTYKLRVLSSNGLSAEASCTVPLNRDLKLKIDTLTVTDTRIDIYWYPSLMAKISITDFPGEVNYYRLYCEMKVYKRSNKQLTYVRQFTGFKNEFFTDKGKDGENIEITSIGLNNVPASDSSVFIVSVLNINKAYYDYQISLNKYSGGDDPFTEVSPVYTNITGGLGIFAAYAINTKTMNLN